MPIAKSPSLQKEIDNYKKLRSPSLNGCGNLIDTFKENDRLYMVIPQFGKNLEQLKQKCNGRFSLKTSLMLTLQMLERIKYIHDCGLLHGDIKPKNFLIGFGKLKHKLYLIDFELAQPFMSEGKHIKKVAKDHIDGTLRFLSVSANQGWPIARRDELESLLYCSIYFMKGDLPWVNLTHQNFLDAYEQIRKLKQLTEETIC
jgi:serine/threonine protein kinase